MFNIWDASDGPWNFTEEFWMGHHNFGMYIRNGTRYVRRTDLGETDIEVICVELKFHKLYYLIVCISAAKC